MLKRNQTGSDDITSLISCKNEFEQLCYKIDKVEALLDHVKNNLNKLEDDVVKAEADLGFGDASIKVPSLFTPLFVSPKLKIN